LVVTRRRSSPPRPTAPRPSRPYYDENAQHEQAQDYLVTATTLYREMDMRLWLDRAETG